MSSFVSVAADNADVTTSFLRQKKLIEDDSNGVIGDNVKELHHVDEKDVGLLGDEVCFFTFSSFSIVASFVWNIRW